MRKSCYTLGHYAAKRRDRSQLKIERSALRPRPSPPHDPPRTSKNPPFAPGTGGGAECVSLKKIEESMGRRRQVHAPVAGFSVPLYVLNPLPSTVQAQIERPRDVGPGDSRVPLPALLAVRDQATLTWRLPSTANAAANLISPCGRRSPLRQHRHTGDGERHPGFVDGRDTFAGFPGPGGCSGEV